MTDPEAPSQGDRTPPDRAGITLTGRALHRARTLGRSQGGVSEGEIVKRALSLYAFVQDELDKGSKFKLETAGGDTEVLRFIYS